MSRCVVIHPNGSTERLDFHPHEHQRLRGLGYKRFTVQVVRLADRQKLSAAVYARATPSAWQGSEAARQLWGRGISAVLLFDEDGEPVEYPAEASPAPTASSSVPPPPTDARMKALDLAVAEHRLKALAHHWLYLIDRNDGDGTPFDELFAAEFELHWSPQVIRTREDFSAWYGLLARRVLKSSHTMTSFAYQALGDGRYAMGVELQWHGFAREQPEHELEARTLHQWTVADSPSQRFARIESARIRTLVPAQRRFR
jgi:hypothetical protein